MKQVWLIYDKAGSRKNQNYIDFYLQQGQEYGLDITLKYREEITIGVHGKKAALLVQGKDLELPDYAIVRCIDPFFSKCLEELGIRVFNSSEVSLICNDKARTLLLGAKLGISCVPTTFHKAKELSAVLRRGKGVIKTLDGHGGTQVYEVTKGMKPPFEEKDFIYQPMIEGKGEDTRVYVVGKKTIGAVKRRAKEGFRSNFSLGGDAVMVEIPAHIQDAVNRIVEELHPDMIGIDFIIDEKGKWLFNEIEDVVGARMLYQASDIDIVHNYLDYIKNI